MLTRLLSFESVSMSASSSSIVAQRDADHSPSASFDSLAMGGLVLLSKSGFGILHIEILAAHKAQASCQERLS